MRHTQVTKLAPLADIAWYNLGYFKVLFRKAGYEGIFHMQPDGEVGSFGDPPREST